MSSGASRSLRSFPHRGDWDNWERGYAVRGDLLGDTAVVFIFNVDKINKEQGRRVPGCKTVQILPGESDDRSKSGIRLSTMHRSKGLEFSVIAMVRVNADVVPPKGLISQAPDAAIRRSLIAGEKSLIHVSATRAKRKLFVSCSGQASELIAHLKPAQREPPSKPQAPPTESVRSPEISRAGHE